EHLYNLGELSKGADRERAASKEYGEYDREWNLAFLEGLCEVGGLAICAATVEIGHRRGRKACAEIGQDFNADILVSGAETINRFAGRFGPVAGLEIVRDNLQTPAEFGAVPISPGSDGFIEFTPGNRLLLKSALSPNVSADLVE